MGDAAVFHECLFSQGKTASKRKDVLPLSSAPELLIIQVKDHSGVFQPDALFLHVWGLEKTKNNYNRCRV